MDEYSEAASPRQSVNYGHKPSEHAFASNVPRPSEQTSIKPSFSITHKLPDYRLITELGKKDKDEEEEEEEEEGEEGEFEEVKEIIDPRNILTKEQIDYFREIFDTFDPEKKERIPTKSITVVLRVMGLNPTKAELKKHMKEIDPTNKGLIDFFAFLLPISQRINDIPETHEDIIEAFKVFDEEETGYVESELLYEYLTTLSEDLEDFEIELLLKMADPKNTGKIHYQKFVEKIMGVKKAKKPKKKKGGKKGKKKK